ncbi:MAG TPA: ABC transporter substrate-binding protein [Amycolatopsis sp.]|nr:ABC transporter substrate-binding protein [Amycolatopsis sp.]
MIRTRLRRLAISTAALALMATACGTTGGGAAEGAITVGFLAPLTSGNSLYAQQMVNTANLAVAAINAQGGAGGHQLKLQVYDDRLSGDTSAQVTQRALTVDGAKVMMGGYTTIEGLAVRKLADARDVLYLATSTVSPQLLADGPKYTFRIANDQSDYVPVLAQAMKSVGVKRALVLHDDAATGTTLFQPMQDAIRAAGITALNPVQFSLGATDMSSPARQVVQQAPDGIVVLNSSGADTGLMIKTLMEQNLRVPMFGLSSLASGDAQKVADYAQLPGAYSVANYQPSKPEYKSFLDQYLKANGGGDPAKVAGTLSDAVPQTWDGFMLLKKALDDTKGDTSGTKLADSISKLKPFVGAAGKAGSGIDFQGTHNAYHASFATFKVQQGVLVEYPSGS